MGSGCIVGSRAIAETNKYFIIKSFSFLVAFYVCSQSIWRWLSQNAFISIKWKCEYFDSEVSEKLIDR